MSFIYGLIAAFVYLVVRRIICAGFEISLASVKVWKRIFGIDATILLLTLVISPGFFLGILTVFGLKVMLYYCLYDDKSQKSEIREEGR